MLAQLLSNPLSQLLFYAIVIPAIFYFVAIRPQQRQRNEHDAMLRALQKGDEIVTAGGLVGEVVYIAQLNKEAVSMDDRVTVKSGETKLIVERGRIAKISRKAGATASKSEAKA